MVNKHGESQCETCRGSRQMPRHLPSFFDNLHCSLMNVHQPTILNIPGTGCLSLKTQGSAGHSEKGPVSLCVCSVVVWKYTGSAGSNVKVSMAGGYSEQQSSPSCS